MNIRIIQNYNTKICFQYLNLKGLLTNSYLGRHSQTQSFMKTLKYKVLLAILLAGCATEKPETPPKQYSIAQFMDIVQINGGAFSPDETKLLISSKETGILMQLK